MVVEESFPGMSEVVARAESGMPAFPAEPENFAIALSGPDDFGISQEGDMALFETDSSPADSPESDEKPSRVVFNFILPE